MNPDTQFLIAILQKSISGNEVKAAEEELKQFKKTPNYILSLLELFNSSITHTIEPYIKQAAAVQFKLFISRKWMQKTKSIISPEQKEFIKTHILDCIIAQPKSIRNQLIVAFQHISSEDYPKQWPSLTKILGGYLLSGNETVLPGTLQIIRVLIKNYEYFSDRDKERHELNTLVKDFFPHLENLMMSVLNFPQAVEAQILVKLILKTFWSATQMGVSAYIRDKHILEKWMAFFIHLLQRPVDSSDPKNVDWKCKKWVGNILTRWLSRFAAPAEQKTKAQKAFAKNFQTNYAPAALNAFLQLLAHHRQGHYLSPRLHQIIYYYLAVSIHYGTTYLILAPHLNTLLRECLFPLLCYTEEDLMLWTEDPVEYIRREYDFEEEFFTPKNAGINFLADLVKYRSRTNLPMVLTFIQELLSKHSSGHISNNIYKETDGLYLIIGSIAGKLIKTEPYCNSLEDLLTKTVFPNFSCESAIVRSRSAWLLGKFAKLKFQNEETYRRAIEAHLNLLHDPDLAVRVFAGIALRNIVGSKQSHEILRPHLLLLMQTLSDLMNQIDNDDLVLTLERIVEAFEDNMPEHAVFLCTHLSQSFVRMIGGGGTDLEDSTCLAAKGCLQAIITLLEALRKSPHLFSSVEGILAPLLEKAFSSSAYIEFLDDFLQILTFLTYFTTPISETLWQLFPLLYHAFENWAIDYAEYILSPLDNYISRGTHVFLSQPRYLEIVFAIYKKFMETTEEESGLLESECGKGCQLVEVVMHNCKGMVDPFVVNCVKMALQRLKTAESKSFQTLLMEVVLNGLYYNCLLTLGVLDECGALQEFFTFWLQSFKQLTRLTDKKLSILAFCQLFRVPLQNLPEIILNGAKDLILFSLRLLRASTKQQKELEKETLEFGNHHNANPHDDDDDFSEHSDIEEDLDNEDGESSNEGEWAMTREYRDDEDIELSEEDGFNDNDGDDDDYFGNGDDDDDSDFLDVLEDDYESPLDSINEVVYFFDSFDILKNRDPPNFENLLLLIPRRESMQFNRWLEMGSKMKLEEQNKTNSEVPHGKSPLKLQEH